MHWNPNLHEHYLEITQLQRTDIRRQKIRDMTTNRINSAKELKVYQKAYALSMEIFEISKDWPKEKDTP